MLVSNSHSFVFHHVPKTGGSSITAALLPYCNTYKGIIPEDNEHHWQDSFHVDKQMHSPLKELKIPQSYFTFAFVRNPFDAIVSAWDPEKDPGFDFWVDKGLEGYLPYLPQYDFLSDNEGNILVDYIGRFETIVKDFYSILEIIKVPLMKLPKYNINKNRKKDYRKNYSIKNRKIVEEKYKKDLEFFGYVF